MIDDKPWLTEPSDVRFEHCGYACRITRNAVMGHLCGYVTLPKDHPWRTCDDVDNIPARVHGGLTYCGEDGVIGFDCAHYGDLSPKTGIRYHGNEIYRHMEYVRAEVSSLAEQAKAAADKGNL